MGDAGLLVLDVVLGSGRHRLESGLHLHPDAGETPVAALGGETHGRPAPLHERFGETRTMTRHAVDIPEATLPWVGGWRVGEPARAGVQSLAWQQDAVRLVLDAPCPLEWIWRPEAEDPARAVRVALPPSPRAAT